MNKKQIEKKLKSLAETFEADRKKIEEFSLKLGYKLDLREQIDKQFVSSVYNIFPILNFSDIFVGEHRKLSLYRLDDFLSEIGICELLERPVIPFVNHLLYNVLKFNDKRSTVTFSCANDYFLKYLQYKKYILKKNIPYKTNTNGNVVISDKDAYNSIKSDFMYANEYDNEILSKITDEDVNEFQNSVVSYYDVYTKYIDIDSDNVINLFLLRQKLEKDVNKCKIIK